MKHLTFVRVALLAAATTASVSQTNDQVALQCPAGASTSCPTGENGVLLIANTQTRTATSSSSTISLGNVDPAYQQIVAFRTDLAPAIVTPVTWATNPLPVPYPNSFDLPVQVWAICTDTNCSGVTTAYRNKLGRFLFHANQALAGERVGINLIAAAPAPGTPATDWIIDETQNANLAPFQDFTSAQCSNLNTKASENQLRRNDAINVYVVRTVDGQPGYGYECPVEGIAVVGRTVYWTTRLHELGHTLSLGDVNGQIIKRYNPQANFMYSYSPNPSDRKFFTEGQIFRIHFNTDSAMNNPLGLRTASARSCGSPNTLPCPPVGTWIWPDE